MKKGLDERIDESVHAPLCVCVCVFDIIAKRVYLRECVGSHSVGRLWKRWIDTVKECLKKK